MTEIYKRLIVPRELEHTVVNLIWANNKKEVKVLNEDSGFSYIFIKSRKNDLSGRLVPSSWLSD